MSKLKKEDILDDPDFKDLSSQKNTISAILTVLELVTLLRVYRPDRL